jgi:hypothetical protein
MVATESGKEDVCFYVQIATMLCYEALSMLKDRPAKFPH